MPSLKRKNTKGTLPEEMPGSKAIKNDEVLNADKDYAHYPPTPTKIVTKHLTKKLKESEKPVVGNNVQDNGDSIVSGDAKIVNGSRKIVNSDNWSDGSGSAFEATEQVLE